MSWLEDYLHYTQWSESPKMFHLWTGVSVLASVLGRKVWWDLGYTPIFPNLYVVLVARSAGLRKTAAVEIGVKLLYNFPQDVEIIADKLTPEYLLTRLGELNKEGKDATALLYAEELQVFMGTDALGTGLIAILTKLYNNPSIFPYKTKGAGKYEITNCCSNLLACSAPQFLRLCLPVEALGGGLAGRIVFPTAIVKERSISRPKRIMPSESEMQNLQLNLVNQLIEIGKITGEYKETEEAGEWYDTWYHSREDDFPEDARTVSYYERKHITLIKVAMIIAISQKRDHIIEKEDFIEALDMLKLVEDDMIYAYGGITFSNTIKDFDRVLEQIKKAGDISHSDLLRKNWSHLNKDEMNVVIGTLKETRQIREETRGRGKWYVFLKNNEGG